MQYYRKVKTSSTKFPQPGKVIVITKEGRTLDYQYTGSDISKICLRDDYEYWLEPVEGKGESAENVIPKMTHELSRYWEQPKRNKIKISKDFAFMDDATFSELKEYSATIPTGVYEGKMWKAMVTIEEADSEPVDKWYLRWFGVSEKDNHCSNHQREIKLNSEQNPDECDARNDAQVYTADYKKQISELKSELEEVRKENERLKKNYL